MENASKALEIAAGVLLAVLIMSLVAYFFTSISEWPQQQDDEMEAEQTAKFNLEYEVYDKKGMYGADVISCLTKAENNNEKYYEGGSFLSGYKYGETYWINVYIKLNKKLEEQMIVYHLQKGSGATEIYNQTLQFGDIKKPEPPIGDGSYYLLEECGFKFFKSPAGKSYTKFEKNDKLENRVNILEGDPTFIDTTTTLITDSDTGKEYNAWLYIKNGDTVDTDSETPLQILLDTASSNMKQVVTNTSKNKEALEAWSTAEWRTALYDFKTRKFRCDNIKYNKITGRVNEIYFSEM